MKPKKIIIYGQAKSGSTALYYKIKNSINENCFCLFEPEEKELKNLNEIKKTVLIKSLDGKLRHYFKNFDKKILITRDPRDRIISSLLYIGGYHKSREQEEQDNIKILEQKESYPGSISLIELFKNLYSISEEEIIDYWKSYLDHILNFKRKNKDCFIIKYEDLIKNDIKELEEYLGFKLVKEVKIDKNLSRVIRTKSSGSWRNWLTKEDIRLLKPIVKEYMQEFNYDFDDWKLNNPQTINPEHCSHYFKRVLKEKKKYRNIRALLSKVRGIVKR